MVVVVVVLVKVVVDTLVKVVELVVVVSHSLHVLLQPDTMCAHKSISRISWQCCNGCSFTMLAQTCLVVLVVVAVVDVEVVVVTVVLDVDDKVVLTGPIEL